MEVVVNIPESKKYCRWDCPFFHEVVTDWGMEESEYYCSYLKSVLKKVSWKKYPYDRALIDKDCPLKLKREAQQ